MVRHVWPPSELHVRPQRKRHHCGMPGHTGGLHLAALCADAAGVLEALDPVDGPEVRGKRRVAHVLVRHVEVALVAPPCQIGETQTGMDDENGTQSADGSLFLKMLLKNITQPNSYPTTVMLEEYTCPYFLETLETSETRHPSPQELRTMKHCWKSS